MPDNPAWNVEEPLEKVTCSSSDCERDLHSFRRMYPRKGQSYRNVQCRVCGVDLIDWSRLDRQDLSDANYTIRSLELELIRHVYWHKPFDQTAVNHAKRKGRVGLRTAAERRLISSSPRPSANCPAMEARLHLPGTSSTTPSTPPQHAAGSASKNGTGFPENVR